TRCATSFAAVREPVTVEHPGGFPSARLLRFATLFEITYNLHDCHPATFFGRVPMPTRSEILDTLAASQEQVTTYFQGLSPEELERPCTASGVPGEAAWRAKDHFAHLAENERNIQILLRL